MDEQQKTAHDLHEPQPRRSQTLAHARKHFQIQQLDEPKQLEHSYYLSNYQVLGQICDFAQYFKWYSTDYVNSKPTLQVVGLDFADV